jgi:opacity protein-like surface antigen
MTPFPKSFRFSTLVTALALCALASPAVSAAADLASGSAKGSLTFDDATAALAYAAAFVDQKDERKPVILLLSTKKLPTEKWKSEFDMMLDKSKFDGIVFFLDKEGKVFRTDVHMKGKQTGASGIFDLKLDNPTSKELTGSATATATEGRSDKLDVAFHATLK